MRIAFLIAVGTMAFLYAQQSSSVKNMHLAHKGKKIVQVLCNKEKLPLASKDLETLMQKIKTSQACPPFSKAKREAVAYYLMYGSSKALQKHISVPENAKCPVCGMFVSKYPKWVAQMRHDDQTYYFDGVKDMMKYYIFDGDFPYERTHISQMVVSDYYTLEMIKAKEAFYVLDSDILGPMGRELIPFKSEEKAKQFLSEHNGRSIVKFDEISDTMLMELDGLL